MRPELIYAPFSAHLNEILPEPPNVRKAQITEARFALVAEA
jgi:hypothetical protein